MRFKFGKIACSYSLGIHLTNWGYPTRRQWEISVDLIKWYVGVELGGK